MSRAESTTSGGANDEQKQKWQDELEDAKSTSTAISIGNVMVVLLCMALHFFAPSMSVDRDWKHSLSQFSSTFTFTAQSDSVENLSSNMLSIFAIAILLLLSSTAFSGSNLMPIIVWCIGSSMFPNLRLESMQAFVFLALITQTVAGSGVAANSPRSAVPLLSLGAASIWTCYLTYSLTSSSSTTPSSASGSPIGSNPVLWAAVPLCLLLQTATDLQARRWIALVFSAVAGALAAYLAVQALFFHTDRAVALLDKLRRYAVNLDVTVQEMAWMPGSMMGELLVYGFRGAAPSTILFVSFLPSALVLISATRLRTDFETAFFFCVLCDPRTTLASFVLVALLMTRKVAPRRSITLRKKDDDDGAARIVRLFAGIGAVLILVTCIAYFVSWGVYRSSQQNMGLYALFGVHLFSTGHLLAAMEKI